MNGAADPPRGLLSGVLAGPKRAAGGAGSSEAATATPAAAASPARLRYLARQARYNASRKGKARNYRYELKHPERRTRWEAARNQLRAAEGTG
jgi:hypothetical protein